LTTLLKGISDYIGTPLEVLEESVSDKKHVYLIGRCAVASEVNRNGRRYSSDLLGREMDRFIREEVTKGRGYAELNHSDNCRGVNIERVCARHVQIVRDGNTWKTKAILCDNHLGDIVKGIVTTGGVLGWSTKGVGDMIEQDGIKEVVQFRLTSIDLVNDPSAGSCWASGILENVSYFIDGDDIIQEAASTARAELRKLERAGTLTEIAKVKLFDDYLRTVLREDVPMNSMGASSSTSGPIQTYDPLLFRKKLQRRLGSLDVDGHDGSSTGGDGPPEYDEYQGYHDKA
jgi:hypothetical protein